MTRTNLKTTTVHEVVQNVLGVVHRWDSHDLTCTLFDVLLGDQSGSCLRCIIEALHIISHHRNVQQYKSELLTRTTILVPPSARLVISSRFGAFDRSVCATVSVISGL